MIITREINGKQIKIGLTDDEIHVAYEVKQLQYDRACAVETISFIAEYLDKIGRFDLGDELMVALDVVAHGSKRLL